MLTHFIRASSRPQFDRDQCPFVLNYFPKSQVIIVLDKSRVSLSSRRNWRHGSRLVLAKMSFSGTFMIFHVLSERIILSMHPPEPGKAVIRFTAEYSNRKYETEGLSSLVRMGHYDSASTD